MIPSGRKTVPRPEKKVAALPMSRRRFIQTAIAIPAGLGALAGYAGVIEPVFRFRTAWHAVTLPGWQGGRLRIAILADIHMGPPQMTPDRLAAIVAKANAAAPDLAVCLGDYTARHPYVTERVAPEITAGVLAGLRAPMGTWAVLGNHDWAEDAAAQHRRGGPTFWHHTLAAAGIGVLDNHASPIEHGGGRAWLAGLGSQRAFLVPPHGADDLGATLARVTTSDPVILLAHEPDIFPALPDRVGLTLAGHTHGGQVRIFGRAPYVPSRYGDRYAHGHFQEGGRQMIVSGGLGCSMAPIRFGMPPELVVVDIRAAADAA